MEDEVRLMIERHKDGPNLPRSDGNYDFWPVPIGIPTPACMIELTAIEGGPSAIWADVAAAIAGTALAGASII